MIHKIEIYPHYTYPTISNQHEQHQQQQYDAAHHQNDANMLRLLRRQSDNQQLLSDKIRLDSENSSTNLSHLLPPYRTVSHYGFNYPSTYMPTFALHPACSMTSVDLQRQKVIAFIKRLNLDAQAVENANKPDGGQQELKEEENVLNTGKEENIYENTKNLHGTNGDSEDNTGSFISVKEIQLNTTAKQRRSSILSQHSKSSDNQQNRHHQGDLQSEQFSSLLSISGTYPNATNSHTGDIEHDHFTTDSGENSSNFDINSRKTTHDNLYRRNFIPLASDSNHSIIDLHEDDEHDPHKPESEQQSQLKSKHSSKFKRNNDNKHITLTLNSLKRRASLLDDKKEKSSPRAIRSKAKDKSSHLLTTQTSFRAQLSDSANSSSESSSASTAIEIHINVHIRNSDCVKNLQNHEQEFKSKLEKVIDDEINLITQELEVASLSPPQCQRECEAQESSSTMQHLNPTQRCLSAPESMFLYGRDPSCVEADRHLLYNFSDSAATTPLPPSISAAVACQENNLLFSSSLPQQTNLYNMRYRHTLAMLEHELELLLNGIIRNMCDCKSKITQISEDIRTATLHVGSLHPSSSAKGKERHMFNHE